jgi:hypothetical protein
MAFTFPGPYIAEGTGQLVFFLIILFWIIAGLLKKASEASKRSGPQPPGGPTRPGGGAAPRPKVRSLSDFLKRIQEMSEEGEKPSAPRQIETEQPTLATVVRTPPPPRSPTVPKKPIARPAVELAESEMELEKAPALIAPVPAEPPRLDAYAIKGPEDHRITQILGGAVSASAFRKGIILSEILGPPRALRPRRHFRARH